ncbi:LYR motif-containing protein 2 [Tolypocladium ophioglossoides CBS 100239]|uniref:LYR motif-containing protein 2 n=1 Tax=Tolypocladium ophioglossoides (strain CBS 100239) TaxID=1163406 RepID=A0A0L0NBS9_TOLOC|nr:LYR motif-containing protein 2 [Tolypocladium ophioglossoides CBS 100239]
MTHGARLVRILTRGYATNRRLEGALSLDHVRPMYRTPLLQHLSLTEWQFLQRARVLSFYRTILRGTKRIGDARTKAETRKHVRDEFERHRNVKDITHIRYLLSTGKTEWESMERYIGGM